MLFFLVKAESGFFHFNAQIICEPVMISVMGDSVLILPLVWIVIDYIGITSINKERQDYYCT